MADDNHAAGKGVPTAYFKVGIFFVYES